jgi:hypothetical protein
VKKIHRYLLVLLLITGALGGGVWWFRNSLSAFWRTSMGAIRVPDQIKPDPEAYLILTADLELRRADLAKRYSDAKTPADKAALENDARIILEHYLPELMRCWLGTPWDFNGTAKAPGAGKIACGYFVATVLKDAGFQLDRYQLAQQPSGNILQSFLPKSSCALTAGEDYQVFSSKVAMREPGIHIIGLDTHVAFLVVAQGSFRFIHSSGSKPWCVVDEKPDQAHVLQKSSWRMLGNLTADPTVLRRWLKQEKIVVKGT